jgi:hypothetical protein
LIRPHVLALGTIRFELEATHGGCRLTFSDVLWFDGSRTRAQFANSVLGGWHWFLDFMMRYLESGEAAPELPEPDYEKITVSGRPLD